jgi:hypothetical protein
MKIGNSWKTTQLLGLISSKKLTHVIRLTKTSLICGGTILTDISLTDYISNMSVKSPSIGQVGQIIIGSIFCLVIN